MKVKLALVTLLGASLLSAVSMVVDEKTLPTEAQKFIAQNFKGEKIKFVKRDIHSFDVTLTDATEIDFNVLGEWTDVDGQYKAIKTDFLPQAVVTKVKATQPQAAIVKVDRELNRYKFKFSNQMEVYTDFEGNVLGSKVD